MDASSRSKFFFYNSLACLLKAIERKRVRIEVRNGVKIDGVLEDVEPTMNLNMSDVTFTPIKGDPIKYTKFYVKGRQIRYVVIPDEVDMIKAMDWQINKRNYFASRERMEQQRMFERKQKMREQRRNKEERAERRAGEGRGVDREGRPSSLSREGAAHRGRGLSTEGRTASLGRDSSHDGSERGRGAHRGRGVEREYEGSEGRTVSLGRQGRGERTEKGGESYRGRGVNRKGEGSRDCKPISSGRDGQQDLAGGIGREGEGSSERGVDREGEASKPSSSGPDGRQEPRTYKEYREQKEQRDQKR